jgi:hypothetical protein
MIGNWRRGLLNIYMGILAHAPAIAAAAAVASCGGAPDLGPASVGAGSHAVSVTVSGSGTVRSSPAAIDCGATCTATLSDGTALTLTATPASDTTFAGWSGDCSGTSPCTLQMKGDLSVRATFVSGPPAPPPGPPPPAPPPPAPPPPAPPSPADECAGLAAASLPDPIIALVEADESQGPCLRGVGDDGNGTFLLGYLAGGGPTFPINRFFEIQGGKAERVGGEVPGGDQTLKLVFSQPSGFSVFSESLNTGHSVLETWSHDGVSVLDTVLAPAAFDHFPISAVGLDPSGGTVAVSNQFTAERGWTTTYRRFDKHGVAETAEVLVDTGQSPVAVGVALSGHALVLTSSSTGGSNWQARWVARDGTPISGVFDLQLSGVPAFHFLLDGSLAVGVESVPLLFQGNATLRYRIEDGAATAGPLPGWLQERATNALFAIRAGKAYATWGSGGQCGLDLEVLSTSGKSCGCLKVPDLGPLASIGRDNSLMVPRSKQAGCSYALYPKVYP